MPDAAWAVSVHPPSLSREKGQPPVLTSPNPLSTLLQRFACARLSQSYLPESGSDFSATFTTMALTTAACGGLRSTPDCRPRRALLHLSYSCASPFGPALLVTQDQFWIVATDKSMIQGHSDIEEPVFVDFIRQLYDDLVRLKEAVPCRTPAEPDAHPAEK